MKEIDFSTAAIFYLPFSLVQFCYIDFFEFVSRHLQRLQVFFKYTRLRMSRFRGISVCS